MHPSNKFPCQSSSFCIIVLTNKQTKGQGWKHELLGGGYHFCWCVSTQPLTDLWAFDSAQFARRSQSPWAWCSCRRLEGCSQASGPGARCSACGGTGPPSAEHAWSSLKPNTQHNSDNVSKRWGGFFHFSDTLPDLVSFSLRVTFSVR